MSALYRLRWVAAAAIFAGVAALAPYAQRAAVPDNALTVWFLESDPQLVAYHQFHEVFGNDEVVLVKVEDPRGVLEAEALAKIGALGDALAAIDGVQEVRSVLNVSDARLEGETLSFAEVGSNPDEATKASLRSSPIFKDRLISADGTQAMLWVQMQVMGDIDVRRDAIVGEIRTVVQGVLGEAAPIAGIGVIYAGLNQITQHDFGLFVGVGYLLMFAMMGWVFRSWRTVLASMGVIIVGSMAALGAYGYAGHRLNMVTVVLPTLIIVLGIADAVHFPTAFAHERQRAPTLAPAELWRRALSRVFVPCLLTTVTTMAGFAALGASPMAVIRHLGVYAAVGLFAALVACVVFMGIAGAGTTNLPVPAIDRLLTYCVKLLHQRRRSVVAASLLLAAFGAWPVVNDTYTLGYLPDDHEVVRDHHAIESSWGYYTPLNFIVRPQGGRTIEDHEVIAGLERFEAEAAAMAEIKSGFGIHTVYRRMASVFDPTLDPKTPLTRQMVAQLEEVFVSELDEDERNQLLKPDGSLGRVLLIGEMGSASALDGLLTRVGEIAERNLAGVATLEPAGYPPLYVQIIDYVMASQIRGFGLALVLIFALMLAWLRSLRLALISLVPNIFPVLVMRGVMGALGIHLDIATATVAAIVIGVAIDDTVHFLHGWREAERLGLSWSDAVDYTYARAGRAAVVTTLLLLAGYPVLMLASVKTVVYFGLLTTVSAIAALFADLLILPLILRAFPARHTEAVHAQRIDPLSEQSI